MMRMTVLLNLVPRVFRLPARGSGGKAKDPGNEVAFSDYLAQQVAGVAPH